MQSLQKWINRPDRSQCLSSRAISVRSLTSPFRSPAHLISWVRRLGAPSETAWLSLPLSVEAVNPPPTLRSYPESPHLKGPALNIEFPAEEQLCPQRFSVCWADIRPSTSAGPSRGPPKAPLGGRRGSRGWNPLSTWPRPPAPALPEKKNSVHSHTIPRLQIGIGVCVKNRNILLFLLVSNRYHESHPHG